MINALGIDVEEWFNISGIEEALKANNPEFFKSRVLNNTTKLLEILNELNVKATFFILGSIAQEFPELVKNISNSGHEVASHSFNHILVYRQRPDEFKRDLIKSTEILKSITAKAVLGFRAPDFSIVKESLWALDVLKEAGLKYDCSIFPVSHPRYGIADAKTTAHEIRDGLIEFPLSTIKIFGCNFPVAGGAYLRILPYKFIRNSIQKLNAQNIPANIYFHPWEIDDEQPRIKLPFFRGLTHYASLKKSALKLRQLLSDFKFAPVSEVLKIGRKD